MARPAAKIHNVQAGSSRHSPSCSVKTRSGPKKQAQVVNVRLPRSGKSAAYAACAEAYRKAAKSPKDKGKKSRRKP